MQNHKRESGALLTVLHFTCRMVVETMSRRINLNRIKVDVKNELAEYRDATAAFWRRLRFYSIIIIYYRIQHTQTHIFCHLCIELFEGERIVCHAKHVILYYLNETDITIFFGGGKNWNW